MLERLQKVLSRAGVASRRKAEEMIVAGQVQVNGKKVTELGTRVDSAHDMIRVDGKLVADIEERVYYVLFKPSGCVTTLSDPEGRQTVRDFLKHVPERVYPVGRLDYDAEGALLLTNDGDLAHKLMHPKFGAQRTYLAKVKGEPTPKTIEQLKAGIRLDDGMAKPLDAALVSHAEKNTWIRLVVAEGRPHLVKRLCEAVGHPVQRLFRASYATINVEGMMAGELRELSSAEVRQLQASLKTKQEAPLPAKGGSGRTLPPRRDARRTVFAPRGKSGGRSKGRAR
jgi:23S rRNA pseudouridine2605 synthase